MLIIIYYIIITVTGIDHSSNISTNVTVYIEDSHMIFECNISKADSDLLGCIIITHHHNNYSILRVGMIDKENPTLELRVEAGNKYSFAVFEWKMMTGIIESDMLLKGTLCEDTSDNSSN